MKKKLEQKIEEVIEIDKDRQKYGLIVMEVPGLEKMNKRDYDFTVRACNHIIEDVKGYQIEGVKLPIGTELKILKV